MLIFSSRFTSSSSSRITCSSCRFRKNSRRCY